MRKHFTLLWEWGATLCPSRGPSSKGTPCLLTGAQYPRCSPSTQAAAALCRNHHEPWARPSLLSSYSSSGLSCHGCSSRFVYLFLFTCALCIACWLPAAPPVHPSPAQPRCRAAQPEQPCQKAPTAPSHSPQPLPALLTQRARRQALKCLPFPAR